MTHNTREVEEWREQFRSCFSDLPDEYECCNGKDCNCNGATVLESIETFIHHQLQKAREEERRQTLKDVNDYLILNYKMTVEKVDELLLTLQ